MDTYKPFESSYGSDSNVALLDAPVETARSGLDDKMLEEIDKVVSYAGHPFYAKEKVLITNKSARLSRSDKKYAEKKRVKIDRISAKSPTRQRKSWWEL